MGIWNSKSMIEDLYEELTKEQNKNDDLHITIELLEEEISYLRPMAKYLIEHLSKKVTLDEFCTIEMMKDDLEYFENRNCDINEAQVYGKK